MTNLTASAIADAAEDLGLPPLEIDPGYSGRCMFGDRTWAIVGPRPDIEDAIQHAKSVLGDPYSCAGRPEIVRELSRLRWDQMGKSDVVCY